MSNMPSLVSFDAFMRVFLALYFTVVAVKYSMMGLGLSARDPRRRIHQGAPGSMARLTRITFNVFRASIWAFAVVRVATPGIDGVLGAYAAPVATQALGALLMLASLGAVEYVGAYMGAEWRSGVDPEGPPTLLTDGPYAATRNPMFLAILTGQLGLSLAWPSLFTLACLGVGMAVILIQARLEERTLEARLGARYQAYRDAVPRFLPLWPGRRAGEKRRASP
jgi:protein-S-isoprenylcysteine O-methyltransferase Ste14